jgi:dynein heavy chain 1
VLNRELRRTGGRVLITLADQDIDLSPSFTIILSTRDPTVEFRPDVCSRVTMVNFTVTRSSLQAQCLNQVLKAERPDIDKKRQDLLKLQGEFQLRLRHLEKNLLQVLNEAKGRILDDNTVISTLETLKKEAADVTSKVEETEEIMVDVEKTSRKYLPLSQACSSIYFTIDNLHQVHFLYQFSLQFFLDIFHSLLADKALLEGVKDYDKRLAVLTAKLFEQSYLRTSRGMLFADKSVLGMILTRIYLQGGEGNGDSLDREFQFILRAKEGLKEAVGAMAPPPDVGAALLAKHFPVEFKGAAAALQSEAGKAWLASAAPEDDVLKLWQEPEGGGAFGENKTKLFELMTVYALRPDRFTAAAQRFIASVMGAAYAASSEVNLAPVVEKEIRAGTPLLFCSVIGFDASDRVVDIAAQCGDRPLSSIAIGSAEGFLQAEKAINTAAKSGRWVLLKNVHLAPSWLVSLEKKLHSLQVHPNFRLFLTCEVTPKLPVNLLRAGRIFTFEPPPGVKANLQRTFATVVPPQRMAKPPNERARLYFMLAWFHAVVQERLRYVPVGWSKAYEFNESDLKSAYEMLDTWVDVTSQGRTNLPPSKVPWQAIQELLSKVIYGGKIDSDYDQRLLETFVCKLFNEHAFESDFHLVASEDLQLKAPEGIRRDQFCAWVDSLPDQQSPAWLGLPNNAENIILAQRARELVRKLMRMQQLDDDDNVVDIGGEGDKGVGSGGTKNTADVRPAWMKTLGDSADGWLRELPDKLPLLKRSAEGLKDPLFRFFEREVRLASTILAKVRADLSDISEICRGNRKQTNQHREIGQQLLKGVVPTAWRRFTAPASATVSLWILNFALRLKQMQEVLQVAGKSGPSSLRTLDYWIGGLFNPEAFITATRQCVAQANFWSLEDLRLRLSTDGDGANNAGLSFGIRQLRLFGAQLSDSHNALRLSRSSLTELPQVRLYWQLKKTKEEEEV